MVSANRSFACFRVACYPPCTLSEDVPTVSELACLSLLPVPSCILVSKLIATDGTRDWLKPS